MSKFTICGLFQAEEFSEAVQVVREWLPHAEAELKFKALPEDEDQIVQLIENHEVRNPLTVPSHCPIPIQIKCLIPMIFLYIPVETHSRIGSRIEIGIDQSEQTVRGLHVNPNDDLYVMDHIFTIALRFVHTMRRLTRHVNRPLHRRR